MATVWLARDTVSDTEVALKVLLPHLRENRLVVERFKREIAAVRRISHPNVIGIYELIETEDVLALVLEHHPGLDLKRLLRRQGPLSSDAVIHLAVQLLDALDAAHQKGVIHRDIKPHNILVDDEGLAKLTDFGLARVDDLVRVTSHTLAFGSPEYVAPELMGSPFVDPRADLYSLAVTLFEAVSGTLPFRASSPLALVKMHQEQTPPDLMERVPEIPEALAAVIEKGLRKDPDDRFATARDMRSALLEPDALALRPESEVSAPERKCGHCGAGLALALPFCVECGHRAIQISAPDPKGRRLFVNQGDYLAENPLNPDSLTFGQKRRLMDTLKEMGGRTVFDERSLDLRLRHLPAAVAEGLNDQEAKEIQKSLKAQGIQVEVGWSGIAGWIQALWHLRAPVWPFLVTLMFLITPLMAILGSIFATAAGLPLDSVMAAAWLMGSGLFTFAWMRRSVARNIPLAHFTGSLGQLPHSEGMVQRAAEVFSQVKTPRLRGVLKKILNRGLSLSARIPREERPQLEALLRDALQRAEALAALEEAVSMLDPVELTDRIQTVEERLEASQDTFQSSELIDEKHRLMDSLRALDEKQEAQAMAYGELLELSSKLSDMGAAWVSSQTLTERAESLEHRLEARAEVELDDPQEV